MINWKTSVGGLLLGVGFALDSAGLPPELIWLPQVMKAIGSIMLGINAVDIKKGEMK